MSSYESLPKPSSYDAAKLDLEIGALEYGTTMDEEFRRRMSGLGNVVVEPASQDNGRGLMQRVIRRIFGIVTHE